MALTKVNGNQISTTTQAIINSLNFNATDSIFRLPSGTTAQRPTGVAYGTLRFNLTTDLAEIYVTNSDGLGTDGWVTVGAGGPHIGSKPTSYVRTNAVVIDESLTLGPTANGGDQYTNGFLVGPIEIAYGYTFTIETGSTLYIAGDDNPTQIMDWATVYQKLSVQDGIFEYGAQRQKIVPFTFNNLDTWLNIDYDVSSSYWVQNMNGNFDINIVNFPTSGGLNLGGSDTNYVYEFDIWLQQGGTGYRPTGNIYINGSYIGGTNWYGLTGPNGSRRALYKLYLSRISQTYTDGSTGNNWWINSAWYEFT